MGELVWIGVYFNGLLFDNVSADSVSEAEDIIKSIEKNGFEEYNEAVKNDWLNIMDGVTPNIKAQLR